jgi:glucose-6-phosphate isomerase
MTLRLDFNSMMADVIGPARGIIRQEIDELAPRASSVAGNIEARRKSGELGFYQLPHDMKAANEVLALARAFRGKCDEFVVLGIGGSALGGVALFRALGHPLHNLLPKSARRGRPRIFFLDNIDPRTFKTTLDFINPEKTIFNVVTKSGDTAETVSQFLVVQQTLTEKLGKEAAKEHIVVTTGTSPNSLRVLAEKAGYPLLVIPENVGGRYSVLSPVGLFPAAMLGIDILELLAGARYIDERSKSDQLWQNPAYLMGTLYYLANTKKGLSIAVMMPYCDALIQVAYWFRQLWAEGLGKARTISGKTVNVGQTPVVAWGTTDQHSQLQLYTEGPFNKLITFLLVEDFGGTVPIPSKQSSEFAYLSGHSLAELIRAEAQATRFTLTRAGRSNMSLILPQVNPFTIGQLLFWLEVQTVFTGGLYDINPLDQPGVEASKHYAYGLMGRRGFEDKAKEIKEWQARPGQYII